MPKYFKALLTAGLIIMSLAMQIASAQAAKVINDIGDPLDLILNSGKLVKLESAATSVFVGNPELADVHVQSPTVIYIFAKKPGRTNLFALDSKGKVLINSPVEIKHDVASLEAALRDLAPNLKIYAESMRDGIVLTGQVPSANLSEDARRISTLFSSGGPIFNRLIVEGSSQVNLRVQIAEVSRSVTKQLGVNWENITLFDKFTFGFAQGRDAFTGGSTILRSGSLSTVVAGFNDGTTSVNALVDALEDEGLITILAEPNLTALSGESASFLAGGEFPVPVPQEDGAIGIEYKDFGVSLDFTPNLVGENRINLKVRPEVSQLSSASAINVGGVFVQSLLTRRAETTVELASGQSFVLGGLLSSDSDNNISKTPMLGDIPIIGALFRSTSFQKNETELVIIVTPYLVKPANSRIALPTDGYVVPNDKDRYLRGKNYRPTLGENNTEKDVPVTSTANRDIKLIGPAGFITE